MCKSDFNALITHDNFESGFFDASLAATGNSGNYVASPLSVLMLLSTLLVSRGPTNETAKEMCMAIVGRKEKETCSDLDYPNIEDTVNDIHTYVRSSKGALWLSSAVFMQKGVKFYPGFVRGGFARLPGDVVQPVFFNTSDAYHRINKWASNVTNGLIDGFFKSESDISKETVMMLLNAIAFKGKWVKSFSNQTTNLDQFYLINDQVVQVPTMHMTGQMTYLNGDDFRVVSKDFEGDRFKFVIFLPTKRFNLNQIERTLIENKFNWDALDEEDNLHEIKLSLPKFKIRYETNLEPVLRLLGIHRLFTRGMAQLKGITEDPTLYAESAKQVALMDVDEYGVKAAAISSISFAPMSLRQYTVFEVDSPFYCSIYDAEMKKLIFIARVFDPR